MKADLLRSRRLLNTWKKWFHREGNSIFWLCYWITPWIHTFWANRSGRQCWLAPPEYQSTHGICCTTDHKTLRNIESQYCHEHQLVFWPFSVDQAMITHILAHYSSTEWWLIPLGDPFAYERCSATDPKAHQHLENRLCHKGKSVVWPLILNQSSLDWVNCYSGEASQHCMPLRWAQKVCIHGVIQ